MLSNFFVTLFLLSFCPFDFSVGVGAFVIGLSQISSFSSFTTWTCCKILGLVDCLGTNCCCYFSCFSRCSFIYYWLIRCWNDCGHFHFCYFSRCCFLCCRNYCCKWCSKTCGICMKVENKKCCSCNEFIPKSYFLFCLIGFIKREQKVIGSIGFPIFRPIINFHLLRNHCGKFQQNWKEANIYETMSSSCSFCDDSHRMDVGWTT